MQVSFNIAKKHLFNINIFASVENFSLFYNFICELINKSVYYEK